MTRAARRPRPTVPEHLASLIESWDLALHVAGKTPKTRTIYTDAVRWLAGSLPPDVDWPDVCSDLTHLRRFLAGLRDAGYSQSYVNQVGRSLQQWFAWLADEEDLPNPFDGRRLRVPPPPRPDATERPVLTTEQLVSLIRHAERERSFVGRRDTAILRLYASTGCRLSELVVDLDAVNQQRREITVVGKAGGIRTVRYNDASALALDRYLRERARHPHAHETRALWLGARRRTGMTSWGLYQVIERRGRAVGLDIHPHLFRHTFAHRWLDNGGAEGDLMEIMGWRSSQMVRHYGRSARGARARRAYDRIDPLGGI